MKPSLNQLLDEGSVRVVIENIAPQVDAGRYPIKRTLQQKVQVTADVFVDGHDLVAADVLFRPKGHKRWQRAPMQDLGNDAFGADFQVDKLGSYEYTVEAWLDPYTTWRRQLVKRRAAGQDLAVALEVGAQLVEACAARHLAKFEGKTVKPAPSSVKAAHKWQSWAESIRRDEQKVLESTQLASQMRANPDPRSVCRAAVVLEVVVEPSCARFSSWYEFFPRSCGPGSVHGTFADCESRLAYVARLGFDVVYFPPLHPIGVQDRKGPNNAPHAGPEVEGSPWAIGADEGGHKSLHPQLGDFEDFQRLLVQAKGLGLAVAMDIAFQCAPDHPYVKQHPQWFRHLPDNSIQYAENPPKKYQDIYPLDFETQDYRRLWQELYSVIEFWIGQQVTIFRVDNPHTKAFRFWEWCIRKIKTQYPQVIFLAEAFTRPKVMHHLAKLGFSQSYTYFTWRTSKQELIDYFTELCLEDAREYFRPNVWPNTPDILHEYLQHGGRPAFMIRLLLAATLSASYGIYGPAFELCEHQAVKPGSEEYLDSEKYQLRQWQLNREDSLADLIAVVNRLRHHHQALQHDWNLRFHAIDNDQLLAYTKCHGDEILLMVINLDYSHTQSGWVNLPLAQLDLPADRSFVAHDLLADVRYEWRGENNFIRLDPHTQPGHIFRLIDSQQQNYHFPSFL